METIKKLSAIFMLLLLTSSSATLYAAGIKYTASAPLNYSGKTNLVIRGDSINGGGAVCIYLRNCSNITIIKCKLQNSTDRGIRLDNCSNITIDSCYFANVADGVYAFQCTGGIKVNYNQFYNIIGPLPKGHAVQFNSCSGGGNTINYNLCQIVNGTGTNPNPNVGDIINIYKSNGSSLDPIRIYGNLLRGGGTGTGSAGNAGIVVGDLGGSYQDVENNKLVNTGYVGIQMQGGTHITIKFNLIYSDLLPWSGCGLATANYSGVPSNSNVIYKNVVNWQAGYLNMGRRDTSYKAGSGVNSNALPDGWATNMVNATTITSNILPAVLVKKQ